MGEVSVGKSETNCPYCGQFIGPSTRCAYCGMRFETRMELRFLRTISVVVAVAGLFLLHLYAAHSELPLVKIGTISPVMNFATVRVCGILESDARELRSGAVLYVLNDGTGTLPVFINQTPTNGLPRSGVHVIASGSLSVAAGNQIRMRAQSVDVQTTPSVLVDKLRLANITIKQVGTRVTVEGRVVKVWTPRSGSNAPHKVVINDSFGSLEVVYWITPEHDIAVGDELEVHGTLTLYKDVIQLKVWEPADIHLRAGRTSTVKIRISEIGSSLKDQVVMVEGVLWQSRSIQGGVTYSLDDGSGLIEVVFWDRNVPGGDRDGLDEGVRVSISAPVGIYKGKVQLVPHDSAGFRILE